MNIIKNICLIILFVFVISCEEEKPETTLKTGMWRGEITAQGNQIPFNFEIINKDGRFHINLINGDEMLAIEHVFLLNDTLSFNLHIFDIEIKAKVENNHLNGFYTKNYAQDYKLPFTAEYDKQGRFDQTQSNGAFDGTWETTFTNKEGQGNEAIGVFHTDKNLVKGTFLTKTGDYRYLDGFTKKDTMYLYSFDGNHIYKFKTIKLNDSILSGEFWSGKTGYYTFKSKKNENATLPDPHTLTYLKDGYDKIDFSFKDLNGETVTLNDEKYKNKVVILQILGTWCPNCMDETRFLANWYKNNKDKDVEIIGLAYEIKDDFNYASSRVRTMKEQLEVEYDILIAGTASTDVASNTLPMLNKVMSFPTTIFIDKKGEVRQIHTGFSGPATGIYYEKFVDDFTDFMNELINE